MSQHVKFLLPEDRIPKRWYNIQADLPKPLPPVLHPGTLNPIGPDDLAPLFPMELIMQEVSTEREIDIPEPEERPDFDPGLASIHIIYGKGKRRGTRKPRPLEEGISEA